MNQIEEEKFDLTIAFAYSLSEMEKILKDLWDNEKISESGIIYLAYPKLKNKLGHNPIHRDEIFRYLEVDEEDGYMKNTEYKFNKMISLDENYTLIGLKYLPRKKNKKSTQKSQRVDDYVENIKDIENYLADYSGELDFYTKLSPGYKKGWARYVYSAKTQKTIDKRLAEMVEILGQGYKSKELYRKKL